MILEQRWLHCFFFFFLLNDATSEYRSNMLCGTFRKKRRHPGDEYRLVRSNTMPRVLSAKEGSLVTVRRTKSSRVAARSSHLRDLLHTVSRAVNARDLYVATRIAIFLAVMQSTSPLQPRRLVTCLVKGRNIGRVDSRLVVLRESCFDFVAFANENLDFIWNRDRV